MNTEPPASASSPSPQQPHTGVTRYDPELAVLICERLASTPQSLVKICQAPDMPGVATIFLWAREHPDFQEMYGMARETQAEVLLEQALDLVDDDSKDVMHLPDGKIVFNRLALQRCKMQVEHRRWIAAKLLPSKYGTHQQQQREKSPATKAPAPIEEPAPDGVITEEYRMELIAERRKVHHQAQAVIAAAAAEAAQTSPPTSEGSPSPAPDLQSPNPAPRSPTSRPQLQLTPSESQSQTRLNPGGLGHAPAGSQSYRPWTDHRPEPWSDVPQPPPRAKRWINRAVS